MSHCRTEKKRKNLKMTEMLKKILVQMSSHEQCPKFAYLISDQEMHGVKYFFI